MAVTVEFQGSGNVIEIQESDRVVTLQDNTTTIEIASTLVASGNYATEAELQAHIDDASAAHAASAISNTPSGNLAATDVQGALNELQTDVDGRAASSHSHATTDVTSGTFADARISESSVTQHQAALSITESQISDLGSYEPALGNPGVNGYVLSSTTGGTRSWVEMTGGGGGNLGDLDDVTITSIASGELLKWNGSAWVNQTLAESNIVPATGGTFSGTLNTAAIVASGHITASVIKPASDSTTALRLTDSAGTAILTVDTTNDNVGINTTPAAMLHVSKNYSTLPGGFNANSDLLMVSRQNNNASIVVQAGVSSTAGLYLGDSANSRASGISYSNSSGVLSFTAESGMAFNQNSAFSTSVLTPATLLHVSSNYSSAPTGFLSNETLLLITRQNSNVSMAIQADVAGDAKIFFGDVNDVDAGIINYDNDTGIMSFTSESGFLFGGDIEAGGIIDYTGTMGNSTLDPTTNAPADWVEIAIGGTTYYLPAYAAS